MKIYIAGFGNKKGITKDGYLKMQLGAANGKVDGYDVYDDTGKNISDKNKYYCELTGLYWMSKNTKDKIVGLVHYRRYFYNSFFTSKNNVLTEDSISKILNKYDLILPKKKYLYGKTIYDHYASCHDKEPLDECRNIIEKIYPDYLEAFDRVMNSKKIYICNMFIGKKKIVDDYCKWLFDILFELEKKCDFGSYDKYNMRVPGFLGERLFNVYLEKNRYKICEKYIWNIENSIFRQKLVYIANKILGVFKK